MFILVCLAHKNVIHAYFDAHSQLGTGDVRDRGEPTLIKQLALLRALHGAHFVSCDAGSDHTVFLTKKGAVYICGIDSDGQQGNGEGVTQTIPRIVLGLHKELITQIACGGGHTLTLTQVGQVYSWGRGVNGRWGEQFGFFFWDS